MRKVILSINLTLDGKLSGPDGELDWMVNDPELGEAFGDAVQAEADTILSGRVTKEAFDGFFGGLAADPATPAKLVEFSRWMVDTPTVVFSRTSTDAHAGGAVAADIPAEVAKLKALPGKAMVLFGGVSTVQEFVRLGLVDEYWIKLHPVVIGEGRALFEHAGHREDLTLIEGRSYASGMAHLRYVVTRR